jgi:MYXO-CTERM domain-containing protein
MRTSKIRSIWLSGFLAIGLWAPAAGADSLAVTEVTQEQNQWCWAGVSRCVLLYYGQDIPQCEIADYTRQVCTWHDFGSVDCCVDPSQGCNYWNYFWTYAGSIEDILDHWGLGTSVLYRVLTTAEIGGQVAIFRPFIFRWGYTSGGGHFLVGHGIDGSTMYYMDPWYGQGHMIADYSWVVADGTHTWTSTMTLDTAAACTCSETNACCDGCRPFENGGACDDGNSCTSGDTCLDGTCSGTPVADGSACDDGDACTQTDTCQAGACTGADDVVCTALDQCHDVGVCNPATGVCPDPPMQDGTSCDDGDACTQTDTCQTGVCTGSDDVVCTALDQCHDAGTCDPGTGICSDPLLADDTPCDDSDACTQVDTCQAGVCTGFDDVVCTALDQCHDAGTCNPGTGVCSDPPAGDGTTCNDGDLCTQVDTCQAGVCTGTDPVACVALDSCHLPGECVPETGICTDPPAADGTACDDSDLCTQIDTCQAGVCTGADPVACTALDACHQIGTCEPATGICSDPPVEDGTTCNDGDACSQLDTCQGGVCTGSDPVVCVASDSCHDAGTCDPLSGLCSDPLKADGEICDDGNPCTQTDTCQAGICEGGNPVVCTALDACHLAGTCDPQTGACSNPFADNGTSCDDGNVCTQLDTCQAGTCVGTDPLDCDDIDECTLDECDPVEGCLHTQGECKTKGGCSCSASRASHGLPAGSAFALLVLGLAFTRRRR